MRKMGPGGRRQNRTEKKKTQVHFSILRAMPAMPGIWGSKKN